MTLLTNFVGSINQPAFISRLHINPAFMKANSTDVVLGVRVVDEDTAGAPAGAP